MSYHHFYLCHKYHEGRSQIIARQIDCSILGTFEREVRLRGGVGDQINDILNEAAKEHNRVKGKKKSGVRRGAAARVRAILASNGMAGGRGGDGGDVQGSGGDGGIGTSVHSEPYIRKCFDRVGRTGTELRIGAGMNDEDRHAASSRFGCVPRTMTTNAPL